MGTPTIHFYDKGSDESPCGDKDPDAFLSSEISHVTCDGCLKAVLRDYQPSKKPVLH